jgi:DNA-binding MarR family transcriptional regulator
MKERASHKEKTGRAFGAYLDLADTADWIRRELAGPLDYFGLTMNEFRLLHMLYNQGPMSVSDAAERRACKIQNMHTLVEGGGGRPPPRQVMWRAPAEIRESRMPKVRRGTPRRGPKVRVVSLTREGRKLIATVLPRQAKLVKSMMRALDLREQDTLGRLCRKLREGDIVKFFQEIRMQDADEDLRV